MEVIEKGEKMISEEILQKFNMPRLVEYSDIYPLMCTVLTLEEDKRRKISYYKKFLKETDYVVIKLAEASLRNNNLDEDYSVVLEARKFARQEINKLI